MSHSSHVPLSDHAAAIEDLEKVEAKTFPAEQAEIYPLPDTTSADSIPDGGLRAWMSVLGGWLVLFCTFGYSNSFGVFQAYYTVPGGPSSSTISWIGSLQLFLMFSMGLPAGRWLDQGYFRYTSIIGTLLYTFFMFMLSLAHSGKYYQLLLSQGLGMGIGSGLLLVPAVSVQAHHWRKRRALAMGIVITGSGFGGVIYPIMLNELIRGPTGFAWGVRASAFLTLGLLAIANCIMTTRLPVRSAKERLPVPKEGTNPIYDRVYLVLMGASFVGLWGVFYVYYYLQVWVERHGLSESLAFYTIAIMNGASVFGRTIPNMIADRVGHYNTLCAITFITSILVFAMFGVTTTGSVIVFSILYGFFSGAYIALLPPTIATLARGVDEIGLLLGLSYFITSFAMLTGTPIVGALLGPDFHWSKSIVFSGVVIVVGAGLNVLSRHFRLQTAGTQWI